MSHVPAAEGLLSESQPDPYSDSSWKIAFLLQLPVSSTILVDGKNGAGLCAGLSRLSYRPVALPLATAEDIRQAGALVVLPGAVSASKLIEETVSRMRGDAQVLVCFLNRWSMYAGVRSGVRNLLSRQSRTIRRATAVSGSVERAEPLVWLPLPKHAVPEEFVALSEPEEVAASLACTQREAWLRARLHDGFGVYSSPPSAGMSVLARALESALEQQGLSCALRVTRFDLRNRGALVLFIMDEANQGAYVCRVVHREVSEHLQRHWRLQAGVRHDLHSHPARLRIPQEVATVQLQEYTCWIETRSPGTVSWRLPLRLRPVLDDQIVGFIADLAAVTGVERPVSDADMDAEAALWSEQIGTKLNGESSDLLGAAFGVLRKHLVGCPAKFGWVHGDYGYGNVLATPHGELSSVIDWETASPQGFVGIDLFNFILQRTRTSENVPLSVAVARTVEKINADRLGADIAVGRYLGRFLPNRTIQLQVLLLTLCRWVRREHRYGLSPPAGSAELRGALSCALQACR